jgi:RHS repeat-associated protein
MLTQGTQTFTWNERDQLTATSSGSGTFAYDALGRRIAKTVAGTSRSYLYDGGDIVFAATWVPASSWAITGGGIDDVLWRREEPLSGGSAISRSFLTDALGSTVGLSDGSNALSSSYTYEPYGKTTATDTNPFRFTGREDDGATGLQFNRARYYSPGLSRFISQDPIGLAGGPNVYGYAGMAPTVFTDPLGLAQTSGSDGFAQMVLGGGNPGQEMGGSPQSQKDCGFAGWRCYDDFLAEHALGIGQVLSVAGGLACIVVTAGPARRSCSSPSA